MKQNEYIVDFNDRILITGANGFIGSKVVEKLAAYGFRNLRCFMRSASASDGLQKVIESSPNANITIVRGNLLTAEDCEKAAEGAKVVYHLASSVGEKSFSEAYRNSVETTKNLLDAVLKMTSIRRFVNVSSFSVYSNMHMRPGDLLDESCPIEGEPKLRGEAYSYAKIKQEELLRAYGAKYHIPYVVLRPGAVYGPGSRSITGRAGIMKFGLFLHMGGSNIIPFTYIDNCAEAIVLAGLRKGVDGEVINVVDDGALTSREFLTMYKKQVGNIRTVSLPRPVSYALFSLLGTLSKVSGKGANSGYNRRRWSAYWKGNTYSNEKLKRLLGWTPNVSLEEGMKRYFTYCKGTGEHDA